MTTVAIVAPATAVASPWRRHLVRLALIAAALVALFPRDIAHVLSTWATSTTFEHCFLVAAILPWLVAQRAALLEPLSPTGWAPGLLVVAVGAMLWIVGTAGEVAVVREFALLVVAQGAVATMLGPVLVRGLAFPLGYACFLVPFGEWMEAPLQAVTVRLVMPILRLIGLPATSDGVVIHAGRYWFEVAEACSGAKFVIAMLALGVLVANLCFHGARRRAAFLAACVAVPILANAVRAAMTMLVADRVGIETAAGFDHIVYGWVWFAVVMVALLAASWRWFDRPAGEPPIDPGAIDRPVRHRLPAGGAMLACLVLLGATAAWGARIDAPRGAPIAAEALPDLPGWRRTAADAGDGWRPHYPGADRLFLARYVDRAGQAVDVAVAVYADQRRGKSVVGYGIGPIGAGPWRRVADLDPFAGMAALRIAAPGPIERVVATRYRVGGYGATTPAGVKLATLATRLFGGSPRAVAVTLSATPGGRYGAASAVARLAAVLPDDPTRPR